MPRQVLTLYTTRSVYLFFDRFRLAVSSRWQKRFAGLPSTPGAAD